MASFGFGFACGLLGFWFIWWTSRQFWDPHRGGMCVIRTQVIEDGVSGLTLDFRASDDSTGCSLRIDGPIPFGNRDLEFDGDGAWSGSGTMLGGCDEDGPDEDPRKTVRSRPGLW
jgi:hypothetical protein